MLKYNTRTLTRTQKDKILESNDWTCVYCFNPADEVDHILPWSHVHDNSQENLVACCWLCNRIAHDKVFDSFSLKRDHILLVRYMWIKGNTIPLWTKGELEELGYSLRIKIEGECLVCEDAEDLRGVRNRLVQEGFKVIDCETVYPEWYWKKAKGRRAKKLI